MAYGFAIESNQPVLSGKVEHAAVEVRDVAWFREQLVVRGVSQLEISWGDYKEYFYLIPPHLLDEYLQLRPKMLHRTAFATIQAMK